MIAKKYPLLNFPQRNGFSKKMNVNLFASAKCSCKPTTFYINLKTEKKYKNRKIILN